ncbi:MAG: DUF998 domain-containing protein [Solirubrobacterales bacterium]
MDERRPHRPERPRALVAAGVLAGLTANYWALETLLADRTDPAGSWISDLGARTEDTGLLFDLLEAASGVVLVAFALLLLPFLAGRSRELRWGCWGLVAVGVCTIVDGAFPLSCGENLAEPCKLRYDIVDLIHGGETFLSIGITIVTFGLFAAGFLRDGAARMRRIGAWTVAAGVAWTACNVLMGAQYLVDDLASAKGIFHRAAQVVLGAWLIALALTARRADP